jgi:hypothetical protein
LNLMPEDPCKVFSAKPSLFRKNHLPASQVCLFFALTRISKSFVKSHAPCCNDGYRYQTK